MSEWQVIQGDCLDVLPTLPDASVDAVVTDPPYGIGYQSGWSESGPRFDTLAGDDQPFIWWLPQAYRVLRDGGCLVCFCRWDTAEAFRQAIGWAGFRVVSQVVWDREAHGMGDLKGAPGPQHDTIWIASKGRFEFHGRRPTSVLRHKRVPADDMEHPTEKPVPLMAEIVGDYCPPGGLVLDPCCGSGATGCGAVRVGRKFIGIEIEPRYAEIARRRCEREAAQPMLIGAGA